MSQPGKEWLYNIMVVSGHADPGNAAAVVRGSIENAKKKKTTRSMVPIRRGLTKALLKVAQQHILMVFINI